ncbi:hypothetical protein [Ornithinimicrobium pratense]|nr:hypothetical protein [Ornithinimicrobium pratense]
MDLLLLGLALGAGVGATPGRLLVAARMLLGFVGVLALVERRPRMVDG